MAIVETYAGPVTRKSLMNKTKSDLCSMVLDYIGLINRKDKHIDDVLQAISQGERLPVAAYCVACGHRWTAICHFSKITGLECPKCGELKGESILSRPELAADYMITALVDFLGLKFDKAIGLALGLVKKSGVCQADRRVVERALHEIMMGQEDSKEG